ncbi:TonB-dependent receptor [Vibrio sp. 404]|uniref:TonB-dependent receptor n=1 Tax=Vibrio marinisediminis TaxID=2758441 RepID=A0A7W2ISG2_9VIBR|nr:TonB-dependent receptor [Vibrio marinisediminis]MBA5761289.1 TonB-dependent receptor [Vibrio marinisediminis]
MKLRSLLLATSCFFAGAVNAESFSLPIWKEEAEALGYELPKAFGLNLSYMSMEQGIDVESIALKGLKIPGLKLGMEAEPGKQVTDVMTLRADVWLFPFLNLYGLVGKLDGYSETDVNVSAKLGFIGPFTGKIENFRLDLDGEIKGAGFVLAGGHEQWFGLVDASYTQTELTVVDGSIDAIVVSPRVGYDFHRNGVPLRLWVGAMYQSVEQELSGSIVDLGLPPALSGLLSDDARFEVKQSLTSEWNTLVGMQYEINKDWYLLGEMGFGERESLFFSIDRRF